MVRTFRRLPLCLLALALMLAGGACSRRQPYQPAGALTHVVASDDETLGEIARRYQVDLSAIINANELTSNRLRAGQRLVIPGGRMPVEKPTPPNTVTKPDFKGRINPELYRPRSTWAGEAIDVAKTDPMTTPYRLTIHHSGDDYGGAGEDGPDLLRRIERIHKGKGWACMGYHFILTRDGQVWEGRPLKYQGAHSTGANNVGNIGICLVGNYDQHPLLPALKAKLCHFINAARKAYNIPATQVYGHRDFKSTECPGRNLYPVVQAYKRGDAATLAQ